MPDPLRSLCLSNMARTLLDNDKAYSPPYWDDCDEGMKAFYTGQAEAAFDALLSTLTDDEPVVMIDGEMYAPGDLYANVLFAVLRNPDQSQVIR